jgi:hypothetical protein
MKLPAEVRNIVYEKDLQDCREVVPKSKVNARQPFVFAPPPAVAPLMQVSHQLRREYGPLFLREGIVRIDIMHVVDFLEAFYAKRPGSVNLEDGVTLPLELHLHSVGLPRGVIHIDLHALMQRVIQMPTPHIHFKHEAIMTRVIAPLVDRNNAVWCDHVRDHVKSAKLSYYKSTLATLPRIRHVEIEHDEVQVRERASMVGNSQLLTGMGLAGVTPPAAPDLAPWSDWTTFLTLTFTPVGTAKLPQSTFLMRNN